MIKTLKKHGNSHALVIEKPIMEQMGIDESSLLNVTVQGNNLVVSPTNVGVGPERLLPIVEEIHKRYGDVLKRLAE